MGDDDRRVRRLRLAAADEAGARAMQPRLADALRCASLPDTGGRLLLVRRLALGRVSPQASAQQIALQLERRVAAAGWRWVDGADPAAADAPAVAFAGVADAHLRLSALLWRGVRPRGWHWPLAVRAYRADASPTENLRRIATALAAMPEAAAALPAWAAAARRDGAAAVLAAAVPEALGDALVRAAWGRPLPPAQASGASADGADTGPPASGRGATASRIDPVAAPPRWLAALWALADGDDPAVAPAASAARPDEASAERGAPAGPARAAAAPGSAPGPGPTAASPTGGVAPPEAASTATGDADRRVALRGARDDAPADTALPETSAAEAVDPVDPLATLPTDVAGLLFLLPVLARVGLDDWADPDDPRTTGFAARVLRAALQRLHHWPAAGDEPDPLWRALAPWPRPAPAFERAAPSAWRQHALRAPASARGVPLPDALAAAADADAQARVWLDAARRWLRREAGVGLASLVQRRGRVAATPTHVDVHFALAAADLRVRRAGLDADPGWHAGLRRAVAFHYGRIDPGGPR